jgi:hypothetical protein
MNDWRFSFYVRNGAENTLGLRGFWTLAIVRYSEEHNVSETGSVSIFRRGGRHLLCWVP